MKWVDLRSDTVTEPTPEMRAAMAAAQVGDDVYGDDPTVNRLEEMAAEMLGKEAALFVPSGTMGNLVAILSQCDRGDEVILGQKAHTFRFEAGGISALGGLHPFPVPNNPDGTLDMQAAEEAIRPDNEHFPRSRMIAIENTHNLCMGAAVSLEATKSVGRLARDHGLLFHIDGARIFNAAVATGHSAAELVGPADTVTFCLSKALCAPVGSIVCGTSATIARGRRVRKQLGGGMRQAGVIAAAGLVALQKMTGRLNQDHTRARRLAAALEEVEGVQVLNPTPQTNMVYLRFASDGKANSQSIVKNLSAQRIRVVPRSEFEMRLVTHYWIDDEDVERTVSALKSALS